MNIGILISGKGSNMLNIAKACDNGTLNARVKIVISNKPSEGIYKAQKIGIPTKIIETKNFNSKLKFENEITNILKINKVSLVCLAGFMKILSKKFVSQWEKRLINIHPSLLPKFKGLNTFEKVLQKKEKKTGCTVHFVNEKLDAGKIILKKSFYINSKDNISSLKKKTQALEYIAYSEAIIKAIK